MSQATAAAPPPPQPSTRAATQPPAPGTAGSSATTSKNRGRTAPTAEELTQARGIPTALTRFRILAAAVVLGFTALTVLQLFLGVNSTLQAARDAEQVIRIQDIQVDLLRADALATNAFLVGGLEPPERRQAYDDAIAAATSSIAAAAEAQSADQEALAELSALVVRYASGMEVARANNRQGLPVGGAYLRQSSAEMRDRGVTILGSLLEANTARAEQSLGNQHPVWVVLPGLAAIGVLVWINRWMAQRFHRTINVGVAAAAAAILVITVGAGMASGSQASENSTLRQGAYHDLTERAASRSAANVAKSAESLRLIARGSGASFEELWTESTEGVQATLPSNLHADWQAYLTAHGEIVAKDDAGDWDGAVEVATSQTAGSSPAFDAFDEGLATHLAALSNQVTTTLRGGAMTPGFLAILALLGGLGATWGAWQGISRRLGEYS